MMVGPSALIQLPAKLAGIDPTPAVYDPAVAENALTAVRPRLLAIPSDRLAIPRLDLDAATRTLLKVHALSQVPEVLALFEGMAGAQQFEMVNLERLRDLSLVTLHLYRKAESEGAFVSKAKVPAELDALSAELEKRVQTVCEALLPNDPVVILLRPGIGYTDRAFDLLGYADLYEKHEAILKGHPLYRAGDKEEARKVGGQLLAAVENSMNGAQRAAVDLMRRAWTLLVPVYFEVRNTGLSIFRYDPAKDERFPSIYLAGRKGSSKGKAAKEDPGAPPAPENK